MELNILSIIVTIIGIIVSVLGFLGFKTNFFHVYKWRKEQLKSIADLFDSDTYKLITSNKFIKTMGQKEKPHDNENLSISKSRFPLSAFLIKNITSDGSGRKRFAILGGSGMGKTTFIASFYYEYIKHFRFSKPIYQIHIIYMGKPDALNLINSITNKKSILILEALDENSDANKNVRTFMRTLDQLTDDFKVVIITCRTQFFSNEESEPDKSSIPQLTMDLIYNKIYISPFTEKETKKYLSNQYGSNSVEYDKAEKIYEKSKELMVRPMVLAFMDSLLDINTDSELTLFDIYDEVIRNWFERERKTQEKLNVKLDVSKLYNFSKELALFIYDKWLKENITYVSEEEYNAFWKKHHFTASPLRLKDRSLLNRKTDGSIKFAHRSFFEFFLAVNSIENPQIIYKKGLDMALTFSKDIFLIHQKEIKSNSCNKQIPNYITYWDDLFLSEINNINPCIDKWVKKLDIFEKENITDSLVWGIQDVLYNIWEILILSIVYDAFKDTQNAIGLISPDGKEYMTERFLLIMNSINIKDLKNNKDELEKIIISHGRIGKIDSLSQEGADFLIQIKSLLDNVNQVKSSLYALLVDIHSAFRCIDTNQCKTNLLLINNRLRNIYDTIDFSKLNLVDFFTDYKKKKEALVFPFIEGTDSFFIQNILYNNFIDLGNGISTEEEIISSVKYILEYKKSRKKEMILCVQKQFDRIIDIVCFLKSISTSLEMKEQYVIVSIFYDVSHILYLVNTDTALCSEQQLEICLNNMLSAKKRINMGGRK